MIVVYLALVWMGLRDPRPAWSPLIALFQARPPRQVGRVAGRRARRRGGAQPKPPAPRLRRPRPRAPSPAARDRRFEARCYRRYAKALFYAASERLSAPVAFTAPHRPARAGPPPQMHPPSKLESHSYANLVIVFSCWPSGSLNA